MPGRRIASAGLGLAHCSICRPTQTSLRSLLSWQSNRSDSVDHSSRSRLSLAHQRHASTSSKHANGRPRITWPRALLAAAPLTATGAAVADVADAPSGGIGTYLADLLLSFPLPSYGLTIVVLALIFRTVITLPITAWQNRRMRRLMLEQAPDMKPIADRIAHEIGPMAVRNGWTNAMFQQELAQRTNAEYERLMKPLKSSQRWLRLAPLLANVPILVGLSYAIRTALTMPGSPLPEAGFLWVEKLGSVDVGIGIAGLLVTFLNAEVQSRNSLKLLEKEEAATAAREEQLQLQESLAAERERQDAKRKQAMRDVLRPVKRDRADAKPAPLPIKAMTKAATAKKSQRQAVRPVTPAPPTQASASSRAQPFADGRGGSVIPQDIPRTPAGVWAWAKEKFEKTLSPAYTLHIFSKLSRAYGVGFFVLASMFVPSGLSLYWLTSMVYTLVQTSVLSLFGKEARPAIELKTKAPDHDADK